MPGMKKKATPSAKPTIAGLKQVNLDKPKAKATAGTKGLKQVNLDKPKATPSPSPSTFAQKSKAAEAELRRLMKLGKVKDIAKTRSQIAKKYGVSPNGFTN
jgi:hypothetical protein